MTKVHRFNQDNPYFLAFKRHAKLAASKMSPLRRIIAPNSADLKADALSRLRSDAEKLHNLKPKYKTTNGFKVYEKLQQEHINNAAANFIMRLTAYTAVIAMVVTSSICSNPVHHQVCILVSSPTNRSFPKPPTD